MKVLIVDDEFAMLLAMKRMLSNMEGVKLVGSFRDAAGALDFVRGSNVDLAILDIMIAGDNGLDLARSLRSIRAELDIVFTTSHAEFALNAYDVYPLDYIVKPISRIRLAQTITRAMNKRSISSDESTERWAGNHAANEDESISNISYVVEAPTLVAPLTSREREVLQGIAAGLTNEEIAEQLQISLSTVKVHVRHIFSKLEAHNRVSAVARAHELAVIGSGSNPIIRRGKFLHEKNDPELL
ncbi:DNA-binding NarL/FixJ family response regulator [Paenibacillus sp. W4I10]|uniref:response regulator transcription factor n=1 Tax=Paenibacillus sp. W4I10 TaxID=3042298 RepID=UPI002780A8BC|nr:response regulator transcription factor [Paenibacillus sp. W4I10]MDQ0723522.1 DNA-binding NarL/FixJ family response regulator [Paenibacillus sp. W4I10]